MVYSSESQLPERLAALARAKRSGSRLEQERILELLCLEERDYCIAFVNRKIASLEASVLPDRLLETAESIFNEALWRIFCNAEHFRGSTTAQAYKWLNTILQNLIIDKTKTTRRRRSLWMKIRDDVLYWAGNDHTENDINENE